MYIDKEKLKEIYPPNFRLDGDIQKGMLMKMELLELRGFFTLEGFEPYTH